MKKIFVFLVILLSSLGISQAQDKDIVTEKIRVEGNCDMCKKRIEDAAYIKGVKRAEWDEHSKMLTVTYRPSKTSRRAIEEHIVKSGHDTEDIHASEGDYKKLPDCCAYKSTSCNHK